MRLRVAAVALVAAVGGALAGTAAPAKALDLGLMDPAYASSDPAAYWGDIAALRPKLLRYDVYWDQIAPTKPVHQRDPADPAYRWGYLDALIRDAAANGYGPCKVVATVWRTPRWASSVTDRPYNYANMPYVQQFRNFVHAAAVRYSGTYDPDGAGPEATLPEIGCWEIWNEPNFNGALRPQKAGATLLSAINYVKLLNGAYAEIRAVGDQYGVKQTVIGGALYRQRSPKGVGPIAFMAAMKARGARFDVLSIHPYNGIPKLGIRDGAIPGVGTRWPDIAIGNFGRFLSTVQQTWPRQRFPIWITEFGWQTTTGEHDQYAVKESDQAKFLKQSVDLFRTRYPRVQKLVWFLIKDEPVQSTDGRQNTWQSGLRRLDGSKKPSYATWVQLTATARK